MINLHVHQGLVLCASCVPDKSPHKSNRCKSKMRGCKLKNGVNWHGELKGGKKKCVKQGLCVYGNMITWFNFNQPIAICDTFTILES